MDFSARSLVDSPKREREFNDFLSRRRVNAWPVAEINESINFIDVF